MKIFVTGGAGFLGRHLCAALRAAGHSVSAPSSRSCDLTKAEDLRVLAEEHYDLIYHLAAWTQAGDFCLHHPGEQWVINQQINTNVLAWWAAKQRDAKLIFMGTSCAYAPGGELVEENYMLGEPIESLYTYAMTKRMLYQGARALHAQFAMRYLCAVPSTLYGPGYPADGRQMHFIFDLIRKILRGKLLGEPVVLWGDGHQRREVVLVEDFVRILLALAERVDNDLVNVGAGEEHSIREFAARICDIVDFPAERIQYDVSRYVGATSKRLSIGKLVTTLPEFVQTPLNDGLRRTIDWFVASEAYR